MKRLSAPLVAIGTVVALAVLWKRNRRTVTDIWDTVKSTMKAWRETADEVEDDLDDAAWQAGRAAGAASEAVDEFKAALESTPEA